MQMPMFPPAAEAISLTATKSDPFGWRMRIAVRLEGQRWTDVPWRQYDGLTMAELLEIVDASAAQIGS